MSTHVLVHMEPDIIEHGDFFSSFSKNTRGTSRIRIKFACPYENAKKMEIR